MPLLRLLLLFVFVVILVLCSCLLLCGSALCASVVFAVGANKLLISYLI